MKFFCEYCGARIDANKDDNCPNCGASYRKNKKFNELEEQKIKTNLAQRKFAEQIYNNTVKGMRFSRIFMIFPLIIFVTIFIIIISNILRFNSVKTINNEKKTTVELNEFGFTSKYNVKVTDYENLGISYDEEYEYVKFNLVVENKTNSELSRENVNCIVDGIAQKNEFSSGYSDLPFFIDANLTVKGSATFLVPIDAKSYDIKYGNYVTIHIEK